jgi:Skp family chaperone for outer membrane proteins
MYDLRNQLREIGEEIGQKDARIQDLEDGIRSKDAELADLEDIAAHKDRLIAQMQQELEDADDQRRKDLEERRRRAEQDLLDKLNQPKKRYIPVKGDAVDEMMAFHIN